MDQILKNLLDPAWWFTIIVSALVGGYLYNTVNRWLAKSSSRYRQWRAASLSREEQNLELLVSEPALLTLHTIHTMIALLLFFFFFGSFIFLPLYDDLVRSSSSPFFTYWIIPGTKREDVIPIVNVMTIVCAGASIIFGYAAMSELSVCQQAYQRLFARKKAEHSASANSLTNSGDISNANGTP